MKWRNSVDHYASSMIVMHWLMFVLLVLVYATIELKSFFPKGSDPRELMKALHFLLGVLVLLLVAMRLFVRFRAGSTPAITPALTPIQQRLSDIKTMVLYAFMIAMPLLGWLTLNAAGKPIPLVEWSLPVLVGEDKDLAHWLKELHELGGTLGYYLIGLHMIAALYHHYVVRDNTFDRISLKQLLKK